MPARALLVLLVMLNIGVALWWGLRPEPIPRPPWAPPDGVPALRLLGESGPAGAVDALPGAAARSVPTEGAAGDPADEGGSGHAGPDGAAVDTDAAPPPASASAPRCLRLGPYASAEAAATARQALLPSLVTHARLRDEAVAPRGWQVGIAPQADRDAAAALATRIRDAGFEDLLVLSQGDQANGIALGRYSTEAAALRRESALREAGFAARAQPLGEAGTRHWLDVAAGPGLDAGAARRTAGAPQARGIDCAGIVATGPAR